MDTLMSIKAELFPSQARRCRQSLTRVVTYIDSNLSGALFVRALARIAGVSSRGFHRAFRQRWGITPHAYVILKRIELAQNLMLTTDDSLSQIALACGMTDQP